MMELKYQNIKPFHELFQVKYVLKLVIGPCEGYWIVRADSAHVYPYLRRMQHQL